MCDKIHLYVWHDSCICVTGSARVLRRNSNTRLGFSLGFKGSCLGSDVTHLCVTKFIYTCDMPHPYVWQEALECCGETATLFESEILLVTGVCDMTITFSKCMLQYVALCHSVALHVCCSMWQSYVWHDNHIYQMCEMPRLKVKSSVSFEKDPLWKWDPSRHWYVWHDSFAWVWHDSFIWGWHDSFMWATCLIWSWDPPLHRYVWHDAFTWEWHDSFMCVIWLSHVCDLTHSCVWHDSFMCVTWLIHVCDMPHLKMRYFSSQVCVMPQCVVVLCCMCVAVCSNVSLCDVACVLQYVAVYRSVVLHVSRSMRQCVAMCRSVMLHVCCSMWQCVTLWCCMCVAVCGSVSQCDVACVLQYVAVCDSHTSDVAHSQVLHVCCSMLQRCVVLHVCCMYVAVCGSHTCDMTITFIKCVRCLIWKWHFRSLLKKSPFICAPW